MTRVFIDTNILVYAHDSTAGDKGRKARQVLEECWENESGALSTQVLLEFYVTVTRKLPHVISRDAARGIIQTYQAWPVYILQVEDILAAPELEAEHSISFWDALIIIAAQCSGATVLISEDLQDGRRFGDLVISNPFKYDQSK